MATNTKCTVPAVQAAGSKSFPARRWVVEVVVVVALSHRLGQSARGWQIRQTESMAEQRDERPNEQCQIVCDLDPADQVPP